MSKLIKNTSLYTFGHIIPKAAQFLLLPLYTRYLTPEDYGIVQSMTVLSTILTIFFTMAIERSIYRLYFDYKTEQGKKDFLGSVFITLIVNATLILVIVLLGKSLVGKIFSSIPFYPFYLYAILTVYFTVFGLVPRIYFQVEQQAGKFILISLSQFIISTGFIVYFVVFSDKGASGMLLGRLLNSIVFIPLFIFIITKIIHFKLKKEIMKESISYSWPMVPGLLSAWILNLSDRVFIERYFSLRDVGLYSLSYKMAEGLLLFTTSFNKAYEPLFFKIANQQDQIEAKRKLFRYNKVYTIILILGALLISLFAKEFTLLLDAKYSTAYQLVPIIMIGILIGQVGGLFNRSIYQEKKTKQIMYLVISSAVVNIILNFLLVPKYGSFGAALSTTITFTFFFIIKYFYSKKCYFIPVAWKEILPYFGIFIGLILFFNIISLKFWWQFGLKVFSVSIVFLYIFNKYKKLIISLIPNRKAK
jgi:O-antigen/teichoic acid export membrane protein